jgi:antitoxin component HigA of HigAB toxin-antitoxin module
MSLHSRRIFALPLISAIVLCVPSISQSAETRIGLSYKQVTAYLDPHFEMKKSTPVRGNTRYMGMSANKMAILEVIGDRSNVSQASITVGLVKDDREAMILNAAMALRFIHNVAPGWSGASDWLGSAMRQSANSDGPVSTVRGNRRVTVNVLKPLGMMTVSVKHK